MKIVTNQHRPRHTDVIRDLLKSATKVWIFVAYLGDSGMNEIEQALKAACTRKLDLELYCGLSQCVTHPDALRRVFTMFRKTKTSKLYLWDQQQTFHPKVYCFFSGSDLTLIIGSANLTSGGMMKNMELSSIHTVSLNSDAANAIGKFRSDIEGDIAVSEMEVAFITPFPFPPKFLLVTKAVLSGAAPHLFNERANVCKAAVIIRFMEFISHS